MRGRSAAYAKLKAIEATAIAMYDAIRSPAVAALYKAAGDTFWKLFADPKNRASAWRKDIKRSGIKNSVRHARTKRKGSA
jgi:hypothetical protein